jgi:hypothetical protein
MCKTAAITAVVGALLFAGVAYGTPVKGTDLIQVGATAPCYTGADLTTPLTDMQNAGSTWTRIGVNWASFETARGTYSSSYITALTNCFTALHAHGSHVLAELGRFTPNWAAETGCNNTTGNCPPEDDATYQEAAAKLGQLFPASNGSDGINAVELWNEPDTGVEWQGTAVDYGAMESYGYIGVKTYSTATVVAGATAHLNYNWDQQALPYEQFNALGVHAYPKDAATYYANPAHYLNLAGSNDSLTGLRNLLCIDATCSTPIWFTEAGFIVGNGPQLTFAQMATGLTDQFNYLATACTGCSNVKEDDWFISWVPSPSQWVPQALIAPNFGLNPAYTAFSNAP